MYTKECETMYEEDMEKYLSQFETGKVEDVKKEVLGIIGVILIAPIVVTIVLTIVKKLKKLKK